MSKKEEKPTEPKVEESAEEKTKKAAEAEKAKVHLEVEKLRSEVMKEIPILHQKIAAAEKDVINLKAKAGNLEGAVITAGDVARVDPVRALEGLKRAIKAAG